MEQIKCPYCQSKRLVIVSGSIKDCYMKSKVETEYRCLDNEIHMFKVIKIIKNNS